MKKADLERLIAALDLAGFEVEEIKRSSSYSGYFDLTVIAKPEPKKA